MKLQFWQKRYSRPTPVFEWIFVFALLSFCVGLTILQYKWTGQISQAEAAQLNARLKEELQALCTAVDSTVSEAYYDLTPEEDELDNNSFNEVHRTLYKDWKATKPPALFKRIGYAVPEGKQLGLYLIRFKEEDLAKEPWPQSWRELETNLTERVSGVGVVEPYADPIGALIEFPVFAKRSRRNTRNGETDRNQLPPPPGGAFFQANPQPPRGEREWAIFELDLDYLSQSWMPRLLGKYLGPNRTPVLSYLKVRTRAFPQRTIFEQGKPEPNGDHKLIRIDFHRNSRSMLGTGGGPAGSGGGWVLEAEQSSDKLTELVSSARRRNMAVAVALNGLLLATGITLLRYTQRSRLLADAQMRFVANVSHELRTPITVIRGASHNLAKGVVNGREKAQQYATLISDHAEQLSEMVEQVLDLGALKSKRVMENGQRVDVAKTIQDAVTATVHERNDMNLEIQIAPSLPQVRGDAGALRRAFQNLINNAAKHGGAGGWIGITGVIDEEGDPKMIEIEIADRGEGIPEHELNEIFKPFYRGATAEADQIRGSGLGLALVKEIIEAHRGSVTVESKPGEGTRFIVRLPTAEP